MIGTFFAIVGRLRFRHLRVAPLGLTLVLSHLLFKLPFLTNRRHFAPKKIDWRRGLSIVIPHQHGVEMLEQCLVRLTRAMACVEEPVEVIIVVNGSGIAKYSVLQTRYAKARWLFSPEPLGFTGAILKGIPTARHGAVYLLNDDMLLEPKALVAVLSWRGPKTFAVASQIFLQDHARRREETGWTSMTMVNGLPNPRHEVPVGSAVRGTVWAGAGSALFHADLLRELMPGCLPFDPFYWEDVDLGVRAWHLGYTSLFCPDSIAWHKHRATVGKFYADDKVTRIFERNRLLFQLRNPFPQQSLTTTLQHLARLDGKSTRELGSLRSCLALWRARWHAYQAPHRDIDYAATTKKIYAPSARQIVVFVSPFVVIPPAHGGAVRTHRLATELAKDFDIILVSDEHDLYDKSDTRGHSPFCAVHLVGGRPEEPVGQKLDRIARVQNHSHRSLKDELRRVVDLYAPALVVVEHVELSGVIEILIAQCPKVILDMHDVLFCPDDPLQAASDSFESDLLDRFDGLVVCSPEDQVLLGNRASCIVPNGCDLDMVQSYTSSRGKYSILFTGPFRAPINWRGIRDFVEQVYSQIVAAVPAVTLTIVGGRGARQMAAACACFANPSIKILEYVEDLHPLLRGCALTINPQAELRGSSIKVVESLASGRVCVSTRVGARGWLKHGFAGLIIAEHLSDFATPIINLLNDDKTRLALEIPERDKLASCSWEAAGREIRSYVETLIKEPGSERTQH